MWKPCHSWDVVVDDVGLKWSFSSRNAHLLNESGDSLVTTTSLTLFSDSLLFLYPPSLS